MLVFFPTLYEDELLYSAIARYHKRSGNISMQDTLLDIYSSIDIAASVFLPSNITRLINNMPANCMYTDEYIIYNHTLYSFYTMFSETKLSKELLMLMKGSVKGNTYAKIGVLAGHLKFNEYFKFCPECLKEDISQYGETYWHRIHQVPGVLVCPKHKIPLHNSTVKTRLFKKSHVVSAEEYNCTLNSNSINYSNEKIDKLYDLATDIEYILNNKINKKDAKWYQNNYMNYLMKSDLASLNKVVNQKELCKSFKEYYKDSFLNLINCNINYKNDNWLKRITRKGKYSDDPIENLLLMKFLDIKIDDFFNVEYSYTPFWNGLGPCLNKFEKHYMEYTSKSSLLKFDSKRQTIVGEFTCSKCGFKYAIKGNKVNLYNLKTAFSTNLSDKVLFELIEGMNLNIYYNEKEYIKNSIKHKDFDRIQNKHRNRWLEYKNNHPSESKTDIVKACGSAHCWLAKHDLEWLNNNSPPAKTPSYNFKRVDWEKRDEETLSKLNTVVEKIYKDKEKPQRITLYKLSYETGFRYLNKKGLEKLPKTSAYLNKVLESYDDIRIRKIKWAINEIIKNDNENLSITRVMYKAGIKFEDKLWKKNAKEEIAKSHDIKH